MDAPGGTAKEISMFLCLLFSCLRVFFSSPSVAMQMVWMCHCYCLQEHWGVHKYRNIYIVWIFTCLVFSSSPRLHSFLASCPFHLLGKFDKQRLMLMDYSSTYQRNRKLKLERYLIITISLCMALCLFSPPGSCRPSLHFITPCSVIWMNLLETQLYENNCIISKPNLPFCSTYTALGYGVLHKNVNGMV